MKNMFKAFSLSEVLITIGVIGVVAAIALPAVIANYQKQRTVSQLKKVYTILNQAFRMSQVDNDTYENWSTINEVGRVEYVNKYWKPYLKVIKICNNYMECGYVKAAPWMNAINTNRSISQIEEGSLILSDGTFLVFRNDIQILVDLNAYSKPNKWGHDFFAFNLSKNGVNAAGMTSAYVNSYCNKTSQKGDNGEWCSGKIIKDGWKIKDDYPW